MVFNHQFNSTRTSVDISKSYNVNLGLDLESENLIQNSLDVGPFL